jgi:hypothetical protein
MESPRLPALEIKIESNGTHGKTIAIAPGIDKRIFRCRKGLVEFVSHGRSLRISEFGSREPQPRRPFRQCRRSRRYAAECYK